MATWDKDNITLKNGQQVSALANNLSILPTTVMASRKNLFCESPLF